MHAGEPTEETDGNLPYQAPELSRLGSIGSLTAGGSDDMKENTGADNMGPRT